MTRACLTQGDGRFSSGPLILLLTGWNQVCIPLVIDTAPTERASTMTTFANIVTNSQGTPLAGFISAMDARQYAQREAASGLGMRRVTDYAGGVTAHYDWGWRVEEEGHKDGSVARYGRKVDALLF